MSNSHVDFKKKRSLVLMGWRERGYSPGCNVLASTRKTIRSFGLDGLGDFGPWRKRKREKNLGWPVSVEGEDRERWIETGPRQNLKIKFYFLFWKLNPNIFKTLQNNLRKYFLERLFQIEIFGTILAFQWHQNNWKMTKVA